MKISELKKVKSALDKREALSASELAKLQEVNFQLAVNETLVFYYKSIKSAVDNKDSRNAQILYICFAKYVAELPTTFFFSAAEKDKCDKQNESQLNLVEVTQKILNLSKAQNLNSSITKAPEKFGERVTDNFREVVDAFTQFRNTIIPIEQKGK